MQPAHTYIPSVELASAYGLTHDHIASLCRKGKIAGAMAGRLWMVDEESLKSYCARMRREREERHRTLSSRFKRELKETVGKPSAPAEPVPRSASAMEWAFAMALIVAFTSGLARAGDIQALKPLETSQYAAAAVSQPLFEDSVLGSIPQAAPFTATEERKEAVSPDSGGAARKNVDDVMRGFALVAGLIRDAIASNVSDTARGVRVVAEVMQYVPQTYGDSASVFVDATFGTGARAFVAAVYLWGDAMSEGYAAAGETIASGSELAAATFLASGSTGGLSAAIAVANAAPAGFY